MNYRPDLGELPDNESEEAEALRILKGRVRELETELREESARLDWLFTCQTEYQNRQSVDAAKFAWGDWRNRKFTVGYRVGGKLVWCVPDEGSAAEDPTMAHQWADDEAVGLTAKLIKNGVNHIELDRI